MCRVKVCFMSLGLMYGFVMTINCTVISTIGNWISIYLGMDPRTIDDYSSSSGEEELAIVEMI
jgi:flagellar biosynthesis protein FliR